MQTSVDTSICGAIINHFTLPNFCKCAKSSYGGKMTCDVGVGNTLTVGASAWFEPCGIPAASFGWEAYVKANGANLAKIGKSWTASFFFAFDIPYASASIGLASGGARAELSGSVSGRRIDAKFGIGFCASLGPFEGCNPNLPWPAPSLPIQLVHGVFTFEKSFCN